MRDFKLYIVEFEEDSIIKPKIYLFDYTVGGNNYQPIIVITHNKFTFLTNNSIQRVWTRVEDIFLWLKGYRQGIIISEFLFLFGWLNLIFLSPEKRWDEVVEKYRLVSTEVIKILEYGKNNDEYWIELNYITR